MFALINISCIFFEYLSMQLFHGITNSRSARARVYSAKCMP